MLLLFSLGSNGSGQLGIGHKEDVSVPKQVLFDDDDADRHPSSLKRIIAGGNHTLLLTGTGDIFWAGDSSTGACGKVTAARAALPSKFRPVNLSLPAAQGQQESAAFKVHLAAATWEASVVTRLDEHGRNTKVYSFGSGLKGELGLGSFIFRTPIPAEIPNFPPPGTEIIDLSACMGHVVAVLSNGEAWGWGNGRKGQLGTSETFIHSPQMIDGVGFRVAKAVCGREFTCLVGDSASGDIAVLGSDKWGVKSGAPSRLVGWKEVAASWGNVFVLSEDGSVTSWGRNEHGQLAPANIPRTKSIAVGSEHVLALSKDGQVTAWGWGEHGNCGPLDSADKAKGQHNVIASSKFIPPGSEITAIGAGCATSWVAIEMPTEYPLESPQT
ncbi:regulator of chromosome condensation 1/beta-lactamase-inhibitor protein II [Lasiosphaeria miniovina]|uniref:Regulator of chromosome condensation 1/beta-lactamase-inhibitor protein II n=1 Tax=Lasiosphaeria miniovina TaxID=1954250 RepID=A0AA40AV39_9PEZI|nr:regulator of chromosome condensation 1/beta-lactamase-inhibitor protein II [Lasiosphaeria miniovina]KAK0722547.1 regulator of chromosome condensation 1/beta-lactamase-inhibitor protein II [Lasiosphaeria miniovina]